MGLYFCLLVTPKTYQKTRFENFLDFCYISCVVHYFFDYFYPKSSHEILKSYWKKNLKEIIQKAEICVYVLDFAVQFSLAKTLICNFLKKKEARKDARFAIDSYLMLIFGKGRSVKTLVSSLLFSNHQPVNL